MQFFSGTEIKATNQVFPNVKTDFPKVCSPKLQGEAGFYPGLKRGVVSSGTSALLELRLVSDCKVGHTLYTVHASQYQMLHEINVVYLLCEYSVGSKSENQKGSRIQNTYSTSCDAKNKTKDSLIKKLTKTEPRIRNFLKNVAIKQKHDSNNFCLDFVFKNTTLLRCFFVKN